MRALGIRDKPTAPASPWQNGVAERLIGSIRRECVDHIVVLGEMHLCRVLKSYADYYNCIRTHRSLNKDAPGFRPVQRTDVISSRAILGGLHHHYAELQFSVHTTKRRPSRFRPAMGILQPVSRVDRRRFLPWIGFHGEHIVRITLGRMRLDHGHRWQRRYA